MRCPICYVTDDKNIEMDISQDNKTGQNIGKCSVCHHPIPLKVELPEFWANCLGCGRATVHDGQRNCKVCGLHLKGK